MEKVEEIPEVDIFGLVEAPFQKESVFRDAYEKKIALLHYVQKLAVKFFDVLLEEFVAAGIKPACLDGAHQSGHKVLHAAR